MLEENQEQDILPDSNLSEEEQVLDPGVLEGESKDSKPMPPPDSPRFNQIYGKMKDAERQLEGIKSAVSEKDSALEELRKHNQALSEKLQAFIESSEKKVQDSKVSEVDKTLSDLKAQRAELYKEGDYESAARIQDQISELTFAKILAAKESGEKKPEIDPVQTAQVEVSKAEIRAAVSSFINTTPWYNSKSENFDAAMAGAAEKLDSILAQRPEWKGRPTSERLADVKRQVEERFGLANSRVMTMPKVGPVGNPQNSSKGISLSDEERKVARLIFNGDSKAEEKYAAQLKLMGRP